MVVKSLLLFIHIISLTCALGAVYILKKVVFSIKHKTPGSCTLIHKITSVVDTFFWLLWISGLLLLAYGFYLDQDYLLNQKIWAKIAVVLLMTFNSVYITKALLPVFMSLKRNDEIGVFKMTMWRFSACISAMGWVLATFFGIAKYLANYKFDQLFYLYVGLVVFAFVLSYIVFSHAKMKRLVARFARVKNELPANAELEKVTR